MTCTKIKWIEECKIPLKQVTKTNSTSLLLSSKKTVCQLILLSASFLTLQMPQAETDPSTTTKILTGENCLKIKNRT